VLAHVPDITQALAELARVTKPGGHLALEFYNPWSLRYVAKRIAGPQKISEGRTEADVYTRWDSPFEIPKLLPKGVRLVDYRGVRVVTPAAFVHKVPFARAAFAALEHRSVRSPLRYFGGFLLAILQKHA
jgi:ubiquinone/menaquinone biosynthesis C-methylase UbiE